MRSSLGRKAAVIFVLRRFRASGAFAAPIIADVLTSFARSSVAPLPTADCIREALFMFCDDEPVCLPSAVEADVRAEAPDEDGECMKGAHDGDRCIGPPATMT